MPFYPKSSDAIISGSHFCSIDDSANLPKRGSPYDIAHVDTAQPPKTGDQPPGDQPPTQTTPPSHEWLRCVHPEGWISFFKQCESYNDELKGIPCHEIRGALEDEVVTKATQDTSASTSAANHEELSELEIPWPPLQFEGGRMVVRGYVDDSRWYACDACDGSKEKALLINPKLSEKEANKLQVNYWNFLHNYPAHHSLPPGAMTAARQALTCHVMEGFVRRSSTRAPFTLAESKALLEHFDLIEKNENEEDVKQLPPAAQLPVWSPMKTRLVAFVLLNVAKHRLASNYGHSTYKEALDEESIHEPSVMFQLLSLIFFCAPLDHRIHIYAAKRSSELRGDIETWPAYIDSLVREWSTFNLAATILLSASVAFLAVPGVDESATRIIVLLSVVFTLGSIISGVYLLWRHQGGGERLEYSISHLKPGSIDLLAIILSTPLTFLGWGVAMFLVAIISYSFLGFQSTIEGLNVSIRGRASIPVLILGTVMLMVMLTTFVFFRSFRKFRCVTDEIFP